MKKQKQRYVSGTYLRVCDRSGFTGKRSEMVKEKWSGLIVLPQFFVKQNPLDRPFRYITEKPRKKDLNKDILPTATDFLTDENDNILTDENGDLLWA